MGPSAGLSEQIRAGAWMLQWAGGQQWGDMPEEVPLGPESAHHLPGGCREGTVESHWQGLRDLPGYRQPVAEAAHGRGLVPSPSSPQPALYSEFPGGSRQSLGPLPRA